MATRQRNLRMEDHLWDAFGEAVERVSPEYDRSAVTREFVRWYVSEPGAELPKRPAEKEASP